MKRTGNPLRPSYAIKHPDDGNPLYDAGRTSSSGRYPGFSNQPETMSNVPVGRPRHGYQQTIAYCPPSSRPFGHPSVGTSANQTRLGQANPGFRFEGASANIADQAAGSQARMTANNITNGYYARNVPPNGNFAQGLYHGGLQGNWYR